MEEEGIVLAIEGNKAIVEMETGQHWEYCPEERERTGKIHLEVDNSIGARPDQKVKFETIAFQKVKGAVIFFGIPIIALILGISQGIYWAEKWEFSQRVRELIGVVFGFILVSIVYLAAFIYYQGLKRKGKLISRIVEIID